MVFKGKSILRTALSWKLAASKLLQSTVNLKKKNQKFETKFIDYLTRLKFVRNMFLDPCTYFITFQHYGKSPSHDEVKATGGTCPICHDNLSEPTKLHCKHIFCEECVSTWFDREKTCPMCRAQVII